MTRPAARNSNTGKVIHSTSAPERCDTQSALNARNKGRYTYTHDWPWWTPGGLWPTTSIQLSAEPDSEAAQDSAAFHGVHPARFPATLAVGDALPIPLDVEFSFGLQLLVTSLDQRR
jgi:hypothetical protein